MDLFLQIVGVALIASILAIILKQSSPGIGTMISLVTCAMIIIVAVTQLRLLSEFVLRLEQITKIDQGLTAPVFKAAGISVVAEIAEMICNDSGNGALGKAIQFTASAVIILISIPMMNMFLELLEGILTSL